MKLIVPDASIILKWVLRGGEDEKDGALSVLHGWLERKHEIMLPSLWLFEVGNIIGRKEPELAPDIMKRLVAYEFAEIKITGALVDAILKITREKKVTFYDASYHTTAISQKGVFITADRDYYNKTKDMGGIRLLHSL